MLLKSGSHSRRFISRYIDYKRSKKELSNLIHWDVDLKAKFVYFPLHLQPELTTSALGDIYVDQLLAIEILSSILPDDWYIYIKENPKQTELMRSKWFFRRLKCIKNAKYLSGNYDTYSLIANSMFVSTITGTSGWEAITGGKNVLVFGNPWYKNLPGVFPYNDDFNLKDILRYSMDHSLLEKEFNNLLKITGEGVIDDTYCSLVENFDESENSQNITNSIIKILGES
jgi:hypothetical protein